MGFLTNMENNTLFYNVLTDASSTGAGNYIDVDNTDFLIISLDVDSTSTLTVQFQGSIQSDVDFSSGQSSDNSWIYLAATDLNNELLQGNSSLTGGDGVSVSSSTTHKHIGINVRGLKWVTANVTSHDSGSVTVKARTYQI